MQLTIKSTNLGYSETLAFNRVGGFLEYSTSELKTNSINYFDIEGRTATVTLIGSTISSELLGILTENGDDSGSNIEYSLTGRNIYFDLTADIFGEFYGIIPKSSIKYNYKTKILSFDLHDLVTAQSKLNFTIDITELNGITVAQKFTLLLDRLNEFTSLPELNILNQYDSTLGLILTNKTLSNSNGLVESNTYVISPWVEGGFYSRLSDELSYNVVFANTVKVDKYAELMQVSNSSIAIKCWFHKGTYREEYLNLWPTTHIPIDIDYYEDYSNPNGQIETDSRPEYRVYSIGTGSSTNYLELETYLISHINTVMATYSTFEANNIPSTTTNNTLTSTLDGATYDLDETILFGTGELKISNIYLQELSDSDDTYMTIQKPLEELLHISNCTIYQDYKTLIIRNKFSNQPATSVATLTDADLYGKESTVVLYDFPSTDYTIFKINSDILDSYYDELLKYLTTYLSIEVSDDHNYALCDILTIDTDDYFILGKKKVPNQSSIEYTMLKST